MCSQGRYAALCVVKVDFGATCAVKVDIELYVQSQSIWSYMCSQGRYRAICAVKVDVQLYR